MSALKYLGVLLLLVGVAILAVPTYMGTLNNTILTVGIVVVVVGFIGHIILNKKIED